MSEWITERLHRDYAQSLRAERMLYDSESEH